MSVIVVFGGGAAGFFAALAAAERHPQARVIILEKNNQLLTKVRLSGGGRCNVTHHCFDPKQLIGNYPRGFQELLSPFMRFQPADTIAWFEKRGVALKTEEDGRVFPCSDTSSTIVDTFLHEAKQKGIEIRLQCRLHTLTREDNRFVCTFLSGERLLCDKVILATGSSPQGYLLAQTFGHTITTCVPSLFTFNVPASPLKELAGVSVEEVVVSVCGHTQKGPLLLTHWGFSGPVVLKLSAFAARELHACDYQTQLTLDWVPGKRPFEALKEWKQLHPHKQIGSENPFHLPKSLWKKLLDDPEKRLAACSHTELQTLSQKLESASYQIEGKTTHKEEFVTCGGVNLKEVHFKTMESKCQPGLFFAGEILDIDGVTGGFNFQNAWTTGWLAGQ